MTPTSCNGTKATPGDKRIIPTEFYSLRGIKRIIPAEFLTP